MRTVAIPNKLLWTILLLVILQCSLYNSAYSQSATQYTCPSSTAPQCGGTCPILEYCFPKQDNSGCECRIANPIASSSGGNNYTCPSSTAPQCGGTCPLLEYCFPTPDNSGCECRLANPIASSSGGNTCESSTAPQCGGTCPQGQVCTNVADGTSNGTCICQWTCNTAEAPACNGSCPGLPEEDVQHYCRDQGGFCACQPDCNGAAPSCGNGICNEPGHPDYECNYPDATHTGCWCGPPPSSTDGPIIKDGEGAPYDTFPYRY